MQAARALRIVALAMATTSIQAQTPARHASLPYPLQVVHIEPLIYSGPKAFAPKNLDAEAIAYLKEQAARVLIRCNGVDYLFTQDYDGRHMLVQAKNVELGVSQHPLEKLDVVNGLEWTGGLGISTEFSRALRSDGLSGPPGWDDWETGAMLTRTLERIHGVWTLDTVPWTTPGNTPLTCELVGNLISGRIRIQDLDRQAEEVARPAAVVETSRSATELAEVFDRNRGAVYALYTRAKRDKPALAGKLVLELTISPDGSVEQCAVISSELNDPEFERRLAARVKLFRFEAKNVGVTALRKEMEFFPDKG